MGRIRLNIRLCFVKLPNISDQRIFRDSMRIGDVDDKSYQDLSDMIEKKLSFMEIPPSEFTVFFREPNGDRLVVDDAYFHGLVKGMCRATESHTKQKHIAYTILPEAQEEDDGISSDDGSSQAEQTTHDVSFEVEVQKQRSFCNGNPALPAADVLGTPPEYCPPRPAGNTCAPLTAANLATFSKQIASTSGTLLAAHTTPPPLVPLATSSSNNNNNSQGVLVPLSQLTCPPQPNFFLRCVLLDVRCKNPKPDLSVTELELADATDPQQYITAVTFDAAVQKEIKNNLRPDGRQVLELRHVYVRRKNDLDMRYATNQHPLLLRIDRASKLEVVQMLSVPLHSKTVAVDRAAAGVVNGNGSGHVVSVRETMRSGGIVDLSDLAAAARRQGPLLPPPSSSSSSYSGGPRRTTFSMSSMTTPTAVSGVIPSTLGKRLREEQHQYVNRALPGEAVHMEPGLIHVGAKDVRAREDTVFMHASKEDLRKERIRRRVEVTSSCFLCGLDCDNEEGTMNKVRRLLEASKRNRGETIPTISQLREALSDGRHNNHNNKNTSNARLLTAAVFVNMSEKTVQPVHCRCAHLCTSYQNGKDMEDIVLLELPTQMCSLCGLPGAFVNCYHPDCNEVYHSVCALYSGGYVNFGKKDPFLPCPACPRHTQVLLSTTKRSGDVLHADESCWTDDIAFDSRVVQSTDLRDPDHNGGQ